MSISCFALEFQKKRIAPNKKPLNFIQIQGLACFILRRGLNYTKKGLLTQYKIERKNYFKREEVMKLLEVNKR